MGVSGKWVKALVTLRKPEGMDRNDKMGYQGKKWKLFRKSFGELGFRRKGLKTSHGTASGRCDSADISPLTAAVASLSRDPPPNLWVVRQEWAATRIQTAFRAFLARWALKALKGVVRIQALVRGRQVRKQAAATLRCMQALVRVQARIRASHVRRSSEGQAVQHVLDQHRKNTNCLRQAEEGWSWLEQCAAAKRRAPSAHKLDPELRSVSAWKNNLTTRRISAKLPKIGKFSPSSWSPSSEVFSGGSRMTTPAAVKIEGKSRDRPNYMNSTKSSEGKLKSSPRLSRKVREWSVDDLQFSGF